jgi:DNA-binding GntR family transcriptional regulator
VATTQPVFPAGIRGENRVWEGISAAGNDRVDREESKSLPAIAITAKSAAYRKDRVRRIRKKPVILKRTEMSENPLFPDLQFRV